MKRNLIKVIVLIISLNCLLSCNNLEKHEKPKYYLFETAEYCDYSDTCKVIYLKSHRQLTETGELYLKNRPADDIDKVYNALEHAVSLNFKYPKITIDTTDYTYDITIHMHLSEDNILSITSAVKLENLELTRYYMPEIYKIDSIRSVFQFLDPLPMIWDYKVDTFNGLYTYTLDLMNYKDIDFKNGERVVLEYDIYKIPIPYQIFLK